MAQEGNLHLRRRRPGELALPESGFPLDKERSARRERRPDRPDAFRIESVVAPRPRSDGREWQHFVDLG